MGRLSDARKKAKKGQPIPAATEVAAAVSPVLAPEEAVAAPAAASEELAEAAAADALVDEILGAAAPAIPASAGQSLPSSGLADDILREWEAKKDSAGERAGKPDLIEEMWPDELIGAGSHDGFGKKPVLGSSGLADEILGTGDGAAKVLANDVLEALRSEAPEDFLPPVRKSLPSSGLAEDILQQVEKPGGRAALGLEEIHQFETFFEEEHADEQLQLVLFEMDGESFALEIDRVQEIIRVPAITRVPHVAKHVRGVCNLRGRIVPVLELRLLMHLPARPVNRDSRIMVLDLAGKQIGVLIDRASEVGHVKVSEVEPPPEEMRSIDRNLVTAVARLGERMIFILDVDRVMSLK